MPAYKCKINCRWQTPSNEAVLLNEKCLLDACEASDSSVLVHILAAYVIFAQHIVLPSFRKP